jgi:hypothetical protein
MNVPMRPPPDDPRDKALDDWPRTIRYCVAVLAERAPAVLGVLLWFAMGH